MQEMTAKRWIIAVLIGLAVLLLLLLAGRARIAVQFAAILFPQPWNRIHGRDRRRWGCRAARAVSRWGRATTPPSPPSASSFRLDPLHWIPRVVEVRLVNPVSCGARLDESGKVRLEALQEWIDSTGNSKASHVSSATIWRWR